MINRRTVLILGAGASKPYGFPTGVELKNEILQRNKSAILASAYERQGTPNYNPFWRHILDLYGKERFSEFFEALRKSGKYSVDAFIEHRPIFTDLGKALIATELIKYEDERNLFQRDGGWYQYLYNRMNARLNEFSNNRVSVITFNYDRSLEQCFLTYIQNDYDLSRKDAAQVLSSIPIVHLHGKLGELPEFSSSGYRRYESKTTEEAVDICTDKIKIIHEDKFEGDEEFNRAHELITEAEVIWFLGFGFDNTNLARLGLPNLLKRPQQILGTTYGLKSGEILQIYYTLFDHYWRLETLNQKGDLDVLSYMRTYANFLV